MSVTQNFDSYNSANSANTGAVPNADFDLKDAQLDEAGAGADGQAGILSGGIGQVAQNATQIVSTLCEFVCQHTKQWQATFQPSLCPLSLGCH